MNHKQQLKTIQIARQKAKELELLRTQRGIILLVLADKFGFRKPRLERFMEEMIKISESYIKANDEGNAISMKDIEKALEEDYKFDVKKYL